MYNVLDLSFRRSIISEIESDENKRRKAEHQRRSDIYRGKQRGYVLSLLEKEFSKETVSEMRTCTSINLVKRIINEQASVYKSPPTRIFSALSEEQALMMDKVYDVLGVNKYLKSLNQKFKLHNQAFLQIIPKDGSLKFRCLAPHQIDVVPSSDDPEVPEIFIISGFDRTHSQIELERGDDLKQDSQYRLGDGVNQKIADHDDFKTKRVYAFWTKHYNFLTNEYGEIISGDTIENPIGMVPFVEIASEKDQQFWVDAASSVVEFNLDFSVVLSDTCNTNRLQSYAQPVISAERLPENVRVGPNHILFLPLDPTRPEMKPTFEFATPSPDMASSLELQDRLVSYFLTCEGIDPKTISGKTEGHKYASGLERLLAMIEKFEATQNDYDAFSILEKKSYMIISRWLNIMQNVDSTIEQLKIGELPEDAGLIVKFSRPEIIRTASELEDSVIKRLDAGLISKAEAISELRGVDLEKANEIAARLDKV